MFQSNPHENNGQTLYLMNLCKRYYQINCFFVNNHITISSSFECWVIEYMKFSRKKKKGFL